MNPPLRGLWRHASVSRASRCFRLHRSASTPRCHLLWLSDRNCRSRFLQALIPNCHRPASGCVRARLPDRLIRGTSPATQAPLIPRMRQECPHKRFPDRGSPVVREADTRPISRNGEEPRSPLCTGAPCVRRSLSGSPQPDGAFRFWSDVRGRRSCFSARARRYISPSRGNSGTCTAARSHVLSRERQCPIPCRDPSQSRAYPRIPLSIRSAIRAMCRIGLTSHVCAPSMRNRDDAGRELYLSVSDSQARQSHLRSHCRCSKARTTDDCHTRRGSPASPARKSRGGQDTDPHP